MLSGETFHMLLILTKKESLWSEVLAFLFLRKRPEAPWHEHQTWSVGHLEYWMAAKFFCGKWRRYNYIFRTTKEREHHEETAAWSKYFQGIFESCDETKVNFCPVRAKLPTKVRSEAENKSILCFKLEWVIEFSLSL